MRLAKQLFSILLLVVFITQTTPHDLLHLLAHHEDNHDNDYTETLVSPYHIHCTALQNILPAFIKAEKARLPSCNHFYSTLLFEFVSDYHFRNDVYLPSRAPPAEV